MNSMTDLAVAPSLSSGRYPTPPAPKQEFGINELWVLLKRRRPIILGSLLAALVLGGILFATATRLYEGTAELQVQKDTADALDLGNFVSASSAASDALETNVELQTEAKMLESESLALRVIKTLHLENSPDFRTTFNPISWALGLLAPAGVPDNPNASIDDAPMRRAHAIKAFEAHLSIKPVTGTRLITVNYLSRDPQTAAAVVNLLVQDLADYSFDTRHDATQKASGWLTDQLSDLRKQSEDLQGKLVDLQHGSGMFSMGQTDSQGKEEVYTPVLDRLQKTATDLQNAQSARILKGALYQVVKDGDPELISTLAGNSTLSSATPGVASSLQLLQNLRSQEASSQAELNSLSTKFGAAYPKVAEVQSSLDTIHQAIKDETQRLSERVKNDYLVAQRVENQEQALFQEQKGEALTLNDKAVEYQIVQQEAEQSRDLYQRLLGRMKEADLVAGMRSSNITLVDRALTPPRPKKPAILLYLAAAIGGGLFIGVCLALFREATDQRLHDLTLLNDEWIGAPIGLLPLFRPDKRIGNSRRSLFSSRSLLAAQSSDVIRSESMIVANAPHSPYAESLRALRTALTQTGDGLPAPRVILVTSSIEGEGKSTLALNLATVFALSNKRVLLVDGDLRTPMLHHRLGLNVDESHGLSALLQANGVADHVRPVSVSLNEGKTMHVLPAGTPALYPAELLASDSMAALVDQWRKDYDYVIIDGAPLVPVTDSALLSRLMDFTLVVVRHGYTDRRLLERTSQILRSQGVRRIGTVVNGLSDTEPQYSYYGKKHLARYEREIHA